MAQETKVVSLRLTPDEIKRIEVVAHALSAQAHNVSVALGEALAIMVRRDLPRFELELEITSKPASKPNKSTKATAA